MIFTGLMMLFFIQSNALSLDDVPNSFVLRKEQELALKMKLVPSVAKVRRKVTIRTDVDAKSDLTFGKIDLLEYSEVKFENNFGVELGLGFGNGKQVDTKVWLGDPRLFPEMKKSEIDFHQEHFVPRDAKDRLAGIFGRQLDDGWRYSSSLSEVLETDKGKILANFSPNGTLTLHKNFSGMPTAQSPWVYFEFELPKGSSWYTQVNFNFREGQLNPFSRHLTTSPTWGGRKKRILINLEELLSKSDMDFRSAFLTDVSINFVLADTGVGSVRKASIALERLTFFKGKPSNQGNVIFLPTINSSTNVNIFDELKKIKDVDDGLWLLNTKLVEDRNKTQKIKEITFQTSYDESIPELFIGNPHFLDELSLDDFSKVLDRKLFLEELPVWKGNINDEVVYRSIRSESSKILSYVVNQRLAPDSYLRADFQVADGVPAFLGLKISGVAEDGGLMEMKGELQPSLPFSLKGFKEIRRLEFFFRDNALGGNVEPAVCLLRGIEIFVLKRSQTFHPKMKKVGIDLTPQASPLFAVVPERFEIVVDDTGDLQLVKRFPVEVKSDGVKTIEYELGSDSLDGLSFFIRIRGWNENQPYERLFELKNKGEIYVADLSLQSIELLVKRTAEVRSPTAIFNLIKLRISNRKFSSGGLLEGGGADKSITFWQDHEPISKSRVGVQKSFFGMSPLVSQKHKIAIESLSFSEVLEGGREITLPKQVFEPGMYFPDLSGYGVQLFLDRDVLSQIDISQDPARDAIVKIPRAQKLPGIVIGLLIVVLVFWQRRRVVTFIDNFFADSRKFWSFELLIILISTKSIFTGGPQDVTKGSLLLLLGYSCAVKYRLRQLVNRKIPIFLIKGDSAPYFGFLVVTLFLCLLLMVLHKNEYAERISVFSYFLLIFGTVVEFISFSRKSDSLKNEN